MRPILLILFSLSVISVRFNDSDQWQVERFYSTCDNINEDESFVLKPFLERIDHLYKRSSKLDTLKSYADAKNFGGGYYFSGYTRVYQYGDFIFIQYPDSSAANKEFDRITGLVKSKVNGPQDWHLETFNKSFSKEGIVLMLANHWIITHPRNCTYDDSVEVPRENKLFDSIEEKGKRLIRIRCNYRKIEMK